VTLQWTAPSGGDAATSYVVEAGSSSGLSDIASLNTGSTSTTLVVIGVPTGTYFVRVRAVNSSGTSAPSNEVVVVVGPVTPCSPVLPPTGLAANVNGSSVAFTWSAPAGCVPTSYVIQIGTSSGASNLANFSTGSTATTFTANAVAPGTYFARVLTAVGSTLSAPSVEIPFTVGACGTVPNAPANLKSTVTGSTVVLTWDPPSGGCAPTSYFVQAGSTAGASNIANVPITVNTLTATNVANGTYFVRVRAANAVGTGAASNEATVIVGPVPPATLFAGFQLIDSATQPGPTTECRIRSFQTMPAQNTTCTLRSTSFTAGSNTIVQYDWTVQYTYDETKTITQSGTGQSVSFTDLCGKTTSTDDGVAQPLSVTLTITDNLGATATATAGVGSQPALFVRLFTCGM
jgi:predicted phage tail protein